MSDGDIDLVNRDPNGINAHLGVCITFHDCHISILINFYFIIIKIAISFKTLFFYVKLDGSFSV